MLKSEWSLENKGKLLHLSITSKTATLVPEFAVEELSLRRTAALVPEFTVKDLPLGWTLLTRTMTIMTTCVCRDANEKITDCFTLLLYYVSYSLLSLAWANIFWAPFCLFLTVYIGQIPQTAMRFATGWTARFRSQEKGGVEIFLYSFIVMLALESTQSPKNWIPVLKGGGRKKHFKNHFLNLAALYSLLSSEHADI